MQFNRNIPYFRIFLFPGRWMPGFVRYEEDGSGRGRKERSASMSQIECKLARTRSNWGFLRWYHIGCCLAPTSSSQKISGNPAYAVSAWEMYFDKKSPLIRPVCIRFVHQVGAKSLLHVWCSNCISQAVASSRVRDPYLDLHCRMSRDCCAPHVSALRHMSSTAFWAQTESPKNYPLILRRSPAIESAVVIRSKWSIIQSNIFGCSVGLKSSAFSSAITIDRVVPVGFEHSQFKLSPNSVSICFFNSFKRSKVSGL